MSETGESVAPEEPNAVKFETFVFDALPLAKNPLILEADRSEEFSPVKNMTGVDSLESSQADQVKRAKRWLANAGHAIKEDAIVEICPRIFPSERALLGADLGKYDLEADSIYLG